MILEIENQQLDICLQQHTKRLPTIVLSHTDTYTLGLENNSGLSDWSFISQSHNTLQYAYPGLNSPDTLSQNSKSLTWFKMAETLCKLLNKLEINRVIFAGSHIGAGVSLHAANLASKFDIDVRGIVAVHPPAFAPSRQSSSREASSSEITATGNFERICCPALILSRADDVNYPVSAAENLARFVEGSVLKIANNVNETSDWPGVVSNFIITNSRVRRSFASR